MYILIYDYLWIYYENTKLACGFSISLSRIANKHQRKPDYHFLNLYNRIVSRKHSAKTSLCIYQSSNNIKTILYKLIWRLLTMQLKYTRFGCMEKMTTVSLYCTDIPQVYNTEVLCSLMPP